jgi:hypothetical protein
MSEIREKKYSSGSCVYQRSSPRWCDIKPNTKAVNITITYDEALKFHMALQHMLLKIAGYNRSTKAGKRAGVNLTIFTEENLQRLVINPGIVDV